MQRHRRRCIAGGDEDRVPTTPDTAEAAGAKADGLIALATTRPPQQPP
jgi:hypothetical protein